MSYPFPFPPLPAIRRKVFVSYHHADEMEVNAFVQAVDHARNAVITRGLGAGMAQDIIDSTDTAYVMRRIREVYLADSTITILMIGNCTWSRKYVDWELQASLRSGPQTRPNGVLGIRLPSFNSGQYPARLNSNLLPPGPPQYGRDCYARVIPYPDTIATLVTHIEDAFAARSSRAHLIVNPRDRQRINLNCGHPWH